MKLELANFHVKNIAFSKSATKFSGGTLYVNKDEIRELVLRGPYFADVELELAVPGDRTRIINILDVVEPRHKISGPGTVFPGALGLPIAVGQGRDLCLKDMALVSTSEPSPGESVHWRDGIIDMWGPGGELSPFSTTLNLVMTLQGKSKFSSDELLEQKADNVIRGSSYSQGYNTAARLAGFRVADYLASVARDSTPGDEEVLELTPADPGLPRVMYSCQVSFHYLYGQHLGWQPTFLHPNELIQGALYISFMDLACDRELAFIYQNHPIIKSLYKRHGADINFLGVLVYINGGERVVEKERITGFGVKLLKMLEVDGLVMTWNGGGHPGIDIMLLCQKCEQAGIKTALLNPQMSRTAEDHGFVHYVPEANAIVNTGNYESTIALPPAARVLGGKMLSAPRIEASGGLSLPLRYMLCATSPMGFAKLGSTLF